jgi:hypothetical protein
MIVACHSIMLLSSTGAALLSVTSTIGNRLKGEVPDAGRRISSYVPGFFCESRNGNSEYR